MMHFDGRPLDDSDPLFAPLLSPVKSRGLAYWKPSKKWRALGYKGAVQRLTGRLGDGQDRVRAAECRAFTASMLRDLGIGTGFQVGSWQWLINRYLHDQFSPFHDVKAITARSYRQLCDYWSNAMTYGDGSPILVADTDFTLLRTQQKAMKDKGRSVSFIRRNFTMLRTLAKYGAVLPERDVRDAAREVSLILSNMRFQMPPKKSVAPTRAQVLAVVDQAEADDLQDFSTGLLLQWLFMLRGIDVFGAWSIAGDDGGIRRTIRDKRGRPVREERWADGLTWDMIEPDMMGFSKVISKTRKSLPDPIRFDMSNTPELRSRLAALASRGRVGPVFLDPANGLPYDNIKRARLFRAIADKVGLPKGIAMMDVRAGAITEGKSLSLGTSDLRDAAGHLNSATTEGYMRGRSDAVAKVVSIRGER